jgi:hypothetical protein
MKNAVSWGGGEAGGYSNFVSFAHLGKECKNISRLSQWFSWKKRKYRLQNMSFSSGIS